MNERDFEEDGLKSSSPPMQPEWFYVENGSRHGPVPASEIKRLLKTGALHPESQVWRSGLSDWKLVRETELVQAIEAVPPPISSQLVRNGFVWVVAMLPLAFGLIDASIIYENQQALFRRWSLGAPAQAAIPEVPASLYGATTLLFCWLDFHRIRKAGYPVRFIVLWALLPPVYLFLRAKLLKQRPSYAIVWIVMFLLALLLVGVAGS